MQPKTTLIHKLTAILGFLAFIALAIISLFIFSYLLILFAIIGFVIFIVGYIRLKWLGVKAPQVSARHYQSAPQQSHQSQQPVQKGRIIDEDKD